MFAFFRSITCALLDAVLPSPVTIALEETPWQPDAAHAYCTRCGSSTGFGEAKADGCARCSEVRFPWARVTRLGAWEAPLTAFIGAMKYRQHWAWAPYFGGHLAESLRLDAPAAPVVVCVPMHWMRRLERGYNQAELIAEKLAKAQGWPYARPLKRARNDPKQMSLSRNQRLLHARGAYALRRNAKAQVNGRHMILVDDVLTTGATLRQCARLLRRAGAASVHVAVVAVSDRKK